MPENRMPRLTPKKVFLKLYRLIAQPKVIHRERLIVRDDSDACANPIFLIGPMRSGTTLLRQVIDSHSRIACPPETFFLRDLARLWADREVRTGVGAMGFDTDGIALGLKQTSDYFFETYRKAKGKARWADKTPRNVTCLPFLEQLYGPGCQYLMIYRHPFDIIESLDRKGWVMDPEMVDGNDPFEDCCQYVRGALDEMEKHERTHPDRCHPVFYDRLVADPEAELKKICAFLGEPWEERMLRYHEVKHDWGPGDPEALMLKGFRPSANNWKDWTAERVARVGGMFQHHLDRLDFETD